jgi:hypothetical protein
MEKEVGVDLAGWMLVFMKVAGDVRKASRAHAGAAG